MKTKLAQVRRQDAAVVRPATPAQVIPFPVSIRAVPVPAMRPSFGLNVVLVLILLLACLLWELMSIPSSTLVDAGHTAVTSPRALLGDASESALREFV